MAQGVSASEYFFGLDLLTCHVSFGWGGQSGIRGRV